METSRVEAAAILRQNVRPRREPNFVGQRVCSKEPQRAACVQWRRSCACSDRGKMDNIEKYCVQLIKFHEKHRELWDPTSPNHYTSNFKADSWKLINKEMKLPVPELKKKIISLSGFSHFFLVYCHMGTNSAVTLCLSHITHGGRGNTEEISAQVRGLPLKGIFVSSSGDALTFRVSRQAQGEAASSGYPATDQW